MKRARIDNNILLLESRRIFKSLADKLVYLEIDKDTQSIMYVSGVDSANITYMMLEDVLNKKGIEEYKKGILHLHSNPIDIYEASLDTPVFPHEGGPPTNHMWIIGFQLSKVFQVVYVKSDTWEDLHSEILPQVQLPIAVLKDEKIITYNEVFESNIAHFTDIESLLLHIVDDTAPLNVIQNDDGYLIPIIMRKTFNMHYVFVLLIDIYTFASSVGQPLALPPAPTEDTIEFNKEDFSSLVRMEVELKQMEIRVKQLEMFAFLERNGIASRLKEIEVYQDQDNQKWVQLDSYKQNMDNKITSIILLNTLIKNFPFGVRGFVLTLTFVIFTFLTVIDIAVRTYGIKETIKHIENTTDFIQP